MSLNSNLSKNLRAIQICRKKSLKDFADELCIARSSLQTILDGNCNLRMDTITQIAQSLDADPLLLLQDPLSPEQLSRSELLLSSIDTYCRLSKEDQEKALQLFDQLMRLLG